MKIKKGLVHETILQCQAFFSHSARDHGGWGSVSYALTCSQWVVLLCINMSWTQGIIKYSTGLIITLSFYGHTFIIIIMVWAPDIPCALHMVCITTYNLCTFYSQCKWYFRYLSLLVSVGIITVVLQMMLWQNDQVINSHNYTCSLYV